MKAMILAAGLGTRLRPLTDTLPKALVEISGRTLLEITLSRLRFFGVSEVIVNVHHFADMIVGYLKSNNNFGMRIEISREDDLLLDTGGGLKKAAWFFLEDAGHSYSIRQSTALAVPKKAESSGALAPEVGGSWGHANNRTTPNQNDQPFILYNVDVLSNIDLRRMLHLHKKHRSLATLAVQSRPSSRLLLFNDELQLCGRGIKNQEAVIPSPGITPTSPDVIPASPVVIPSEARNRGTVSRPIEKIVNNVISSAARNPSSGVGGPSEASDCHSERSSEEPAFTSRSPLATRLPAGAGHPPLPLAFSGIHVISPRLLPMLTENGVFSIIDAYLRLASQGEKIRAFRADDYYWRDLGKPADLSQAALDLQQNVLQL